jgi:Uncharacterized conserved protein
VRSPISSACCSRTASASCKFFLHISPEEQLKRFEERLRDPLKRWKLSYEDFRNREKWDAYVVATEEMFERTGDAAPWTLVAANNKKHARIAVLTEVKKRLAKGVDLSPPTLDDKIIEAAKDHLDLAPSLVADLRGRN